MHPVEAADRLLGHLLEVIRGQTAPERQHPITIGAANGPQGEIRTPPQSPLGRFPDIGDGNSLAIASRRVQRRHEVVSDSLDITRLMSSIPNPAEMSKGAADSPPGAPRIPAEWP